MVYEYLQDKGVVDFSIATEIIGEFIGRGTTLLPTDSDATRAVSDLMHLNAAEIALAPGVESPDSLTPLRVNEQAAMFAISASDSGPFVGHDPREQPRLWDATLFGSDASKLAWLAETDSVSAVAERFVEVTRRLAELYETYDDAVGYGRPELVGLRATLWRAKIAVIQVETELTPIMEVYESLRPNPA